MNEVRVCPHCGYDLAHDAPLLLNEFAMMGPNSPLFYLGKPIDMTESERIVIWTIFKAYPRAVSRDVILNRLDTDSGYNIIEVYLSRVRRKLEAIGAPIPFESRSGLKSWRLT